MVRVILFYIIMSITTVISIGCFKGSEDSDWTIEWQYLSSNDTSAVFKGKKYSITNSLSLTERTDNIDSLGRILIHIIMPGFDDDVISQNPSLNCVVFENDSSLFDTTINWEQMEFKEQYSDFYGRVAKNVSKKIIYIKE